MKTGVENTDCIGDAASCAYGSTCCEMDNTKCGGLSVTCTGSTYKPSTDAWKSTPATDANKATACCVAKAKCSAATCPAGYKTKANPATTDCETDAASCSSTIFFSTCCEANALTCGGNNEAPTACATNTKAKCAMDMTGMCDNNNGAGWMTACTAGVNTCKATATTATTLK